MNRWGFVGVTLSMDRLATTSETMKALRSEGYQMAGTITASNLTRQYGGVTAPVLEIYGDILSVAKGSFIGAVSQRGALWTFTNYIRSPTSLQVSVQSLVERICSFLDLEPGQRTVHAIFFSFLPLNLQYPFATRLKLHGRERS